MAQRYLEAAVAGNPADTQSAARLKTTELVMKMDPFRREISAVQRRRIVIQAFAAAGGRLKVCSAAGNSSGPPSSGTPQPSLLEDCTKMKPRITEQSLQRNPDLIEVAMNLVFDIERQTSAACGSPTGIDMALLLISKLHEGNE